jgi:hypothetical protein
MKMCGLCVTVWCLLRHYHRKKLKLETTSGLIPSDTDIMGPYPLSSI